MTTIIMFYGPPAVGKETVARELQKITGYHLILNHQFADLVGPIFGFGTDTARRLNARIREIVYAAVAKNKIKGVISTVSYYGDEQSNGRVERWVRAVEKHNGKISFVRLFCSEKNLLQRVCNPARSASHKISDARKLKDILKHTNIQSSIPPEIAESFSVSTSRYTPKEAAEHIKKHYQLPS